MASTIAKTVVATGASSGLGFEALKQLLANQTQQPYKLIVGARNIATTQAAYNALGFDAAKHTLKVLPLELNDLKNVQAFARQTLEQLGDQPVDYLFLNAAVSQASEEKSSFGSKWCDAYTINSLSQHYLIHLLREKLIASKGRVVVVSSGAIRNVPDPSTLEATLKTGSGANGVQVYCASKFTQLLNAHWWRRELKGKCDVVAVSPGLIPATGLSRHPTSGFRPSANMPDAKSVPEGAASLLAAFTRSDFPEDPNQIFLTSWGEWWGVDVLEKSLDKTLWDKWSPGKEEIEKEEGLDAA